ncbi:MAG: hypothetical protein WCQ41_03955 [Bacillota bacterium]
MPKPYSVGLLSVLEGKKGRENRGIGAEKWQFMVRGVQGVAPFSDSPVPFIGSEFCGIMLTSFIVGDVMETVDLRHFINGKGFLMIFRTDWML